jgi:hypothetical protein
VLIWALYNPLLIPAVVAPICGYLGARNCRWNLVIVYVIALIAHVGYRIYTIIVWQPLLAKATSGCFICFNVSKQSPFKRHHSNLKTQLTVITFGCWFAHSLRRLGEPERQTLQDWFLSSRSTNENQVIPEGLRSHRMYQGYRPITV